MITIAEKEAIIKYAEYLLVNELVEPILMKHIDDADVISACIDKIYDTMDELGREIDNHRNDMSVDISNKAK